MASAWNSRPFEQALRSINGRNYCVYSRGNTGPDRIADLVFFNGLFNGASSWAYQTRQPALLKQFRLVLFDYPCQGGSSAITEGMTAYDLVRDIVDLLIQLEVKMPVFIGHSVGGMLASIVAGIAAGDVNFESAVQGVMTVNTGIRASESADSMFDDIRSRLQAIHAEQLSGVAERNAIKNVFRGFVLQALSGHYRDMMEPFIEDLLEGYAGYNRNPQALVFLLSMLSEQNRSRMPLKDFLHHVTCPVLLVAGANDRIFTPAQVKDLADTFENAECRVMDDAGHSVMLEQGRVFNAQLLAFLTQLFGDAVADVAPGRISGLNAKRMTDMKRTESEGSP